MPNVINLFPVAGARGFAQARPDLHKLATEADTHTHAVALAAAMATPPQQGVGEPALKIEHLVALVLRSCRRHGRRPPRLRPLLAQELERHCERGDVTALALRTWIERSTPIDQQIANLVETGKA